MGQETECTQGQKPRGRNYQMDFEQTHGIRETYTQQKVSTSTQITQVKNDAWEPMEVVSMIYNQCIHIILWPKKIAIGQWYPRDMPVIRPWYARDRVKLIEP